jgi:hypothetical protein
MGSSYQIAFCRGGEGFSGSRPWRERWDLKVGAAVPSGDLRASVETTNRRSESGSHIFIERGAAPRHEKPV